MLPLVKQALLRSLGSLVHWYNVAALHAGVAELVDAPDSKSGDRKIVWVRVPPPAQDKLPANKHFFYGRQKVPDIESGGFGSSTAAVGYE
jgi:hypothetical protein